MAKVESEELSGFLSSEGQGSLEFSESTSYSAGGGDNHSKKSGGSGKVTKPSSKNKARKVLADLFMEETSDMYDINKMSKDVQSETILEEDLKGKKDGDDDEDLQCKTALDEEEKNNTNACPKPREVGTLSSQRREGLAETATKLAQNSRKDRGSVDASDKKPSRGTSGVQVPCSATARARPTQPSGPFAWIFAACFTGSPPNLNDDEVRDETNQFAGLPAVDELPAASMGLGRDEFAVPVRAM